MKSSIQGIIREIDRGLTYEAVAAKLKRKGVAATAEGVRSALRRHYARNVAIEERAPEANYERILCISDMHAPFNHPDTVAFLTAVKKKYDPTHVVCLGDEVDHHNLSFHDTDPDLPGPSDELNQAIAQLRPLYKLFPVVDLIDSNHGSMVYRKGLHHGIPRKYLRDYREVLEAPVGWTWHMDLLITTPTGEDIFFHHGLSANIMRVVEQRGICAVQGHFHNKFSIGYLGTPRALLWGMQIGCSIDGKALAFAYDRTNLARPIVGHGIIINGQPRLLPMVLERGGRWNGSVP